VPVMTFWGFHVVLLPKCYQNVNRFECECVFMISARVCVRILVSLFAACAKPKRRTHWHRRHYSIFKTMTTPKPADNRWCLFNCKSHFSCLSPSLSRCSEMKSPLPTHHRLVLTCSNTSHANLPNMFFFPIINYSNRKLNSKQTEMRLKIGREKRN